MTQEELLKTRRLLYKATPLKLALVNQLASLIKDCFPNVETNSIRFDTSHLRLAHLTVKMIEIDPQILGGVLVHWYPNYKVSTQSDPYCSAYILSVKEIRKLIKTVQDVSNYYIEHNKK